MQGVQSSVRVVDDEINDVAVFKLEDVVSCGAWWSIWRERARGKRLIEQRGRRFGQKRNVVEEEVLRRGRGQGASREQNVDGLCRRLEKLVVVFGVKKKDKKEVRVSRRRCSPSISTSSLKRSFLSSLKKGIESQSAYQDDRNSSDDGGRGKRQATTATAILEEERERDCDTG